MTGPGKNKTKSPCYFLEANEMRVFSSTTRALTCSAFSDKSQIDFILRAANAGHIVAHNIAQTLTLLTAQFMDSLSRVKILFS